ncbi:hypothetical protein GpartN1_g4289.t1 [Galdieria partita]|uniref:DUF885 domain-containing protein n=1 Tax=Galdieria partita TaxID=83374 RepID=A0A9C7PXB5_9RHOD|nr:hypothetical protein GpartN1_g4254.t1 [Galdieria partita]GJQ12498.1 hypothetical protein GpartN1_g4289.t1 [Galdieria partita]
MLDPNSVRNFKAPISVEPYAIDHENKASQWLWNLYAELWDEEMRNDPLSATMIGDYRWNSYLKDLSFEAHEEHYQSLKRLNTEVTQSKLSSLLPETEVDNYEFLREMLRVSILSLETFDRYEIPTTHIFGPPVMLPLAGNFHPWNSKEDTESFLARLAAFPKQVTQMIEAFRHGIHTGYVLPVESVEALISICKAQGEKDAMNSPFYDSAATSFEKWVGDTEALKHVIEKSVLPGYKLLADFLQDEYRPNARQTAGIIHWKDSKNIYQGAIEYYTSLSYTAEELHLIGKKEVERISKEITRVRARLQQTEGSFVSFIAQLRQNPQLFAKDGQSIIQLYKDILGKIRSKVSHYFVNLPRAELEVKPIESYREKSAPPAHYYPAPKDRSRPAVFYANTSEPTTRPLYAMKAVALHEGIPGHHLQVAIAQELDHLPRIRREVQGFCIGYVEGWGLYAEYLGNVMNVYEDDYDLLGRLLAEIWRACRLVVDTGLHALGWTREESVQYMRENAGITEADIQVEIDRYMVMPGQALAYKVGEMKIIQLLQVAQEQLKEKFSWPLFHDCVLRSGAVPLSMLERNVESFLSRQR